MDPVFRAGGLASGLDTNLIVDGLVKLQSVPLDELRARQNGFRAQLSTIGDIVSKLGALRDASKALGDNGVLGVKTTSTNTAFSVEPGSSSVAGRYQVEVLGLASAAHTRTDAFATTDKVKAGTLTLRSFGTNYNITIKNGDNLAAVAASIRASGASVSAVVLNDGTSDYLSISNRDTGFGSEAALQITETYTGTTGKELSLNTNLVAATNSSVKVDGLTFNRTKNVITDAVPGTTLTLKALTTAPETLVLENDTTATAKNAQKFVDAYNAVASVVQRNLSPAPGTDRQTTLAGDGAIRSLQRSLQSLTVANVPGLGNIRTLADVGIKTGRDGTLSVDSTVLARALSQSPDAINKLFSTAQTGIYAVAKGIADLNTRSVNGVLTARTAGLNASIKSLDRAADGMQTRIDSFKDNLIKQFTSMEKVIAGLKATGNFLTQQQSNGSK